MMSDSRLSIKQIMEDACGSNSVVAAAPYTIDDIEPIAVVKPSTLDDLSKVMSVANQNDVSVSPWGGGTRHELGNVASRYDTAVDLSMLNKVISHNAADLTVTVEAGITLTALKDVLASQGQFLPIDAALYERATIGGILASGASGTLKWHNGSARDFVIGMKVVQADGRVVKSGGQVVKNVSGYDMARLHIGSIGSLGIISEVSFKLIPIPRKQATLVTAYNSIEDAYSAAMDIFNSQVMPLSLTVFNSKANEIGNLFEKKGNQYLAIKLGGRPKTLERFVDDTGAICRSAGSTNITDISDDDSESFWRCLTDFGYSNGLAHMIGRISLLPSDCVKLESVLADSDPAIVSQPGFGMSQVNWYQHPSGQFGDLAESTRELVSELGGSVIFERIPLENKSKLDVWGRTGGSYKIMKSLKEQYDPKAILNPGRFVGGI